MWYLTKCFTLISKQMRHCGLHDMHWGSSMAILSNLRRTDEPLQKRRTTPLNCLRLIFFQVDQSLKNIYRFLQRLSVGLEQIVFDQNMYDGRFMEEFNEAEFKLKAVGILSLIQLRTHSNSQIRDLGKIFII